VPGLPLGAASRLTLNGTGAGTAGTQSISISLASTPLFVVLTAGNTPGPAPVSAEFAAAAAAALADGGPAAPSRALALPALDDAALPDGTTAAA
jgi:hypothetical protein